MNVTDQKGVALLTAMLVVSLVTIAAVAMVSRQQLDIRRSANLFQSDQAYQYAVGMEQWAFQLLRRDAQKSSTDHLKEDWALTFPPIPVDGGQIAGSLEDLQGRFNLNNLVQGGKVNQVAKERFERLLITLDLQPDLTAAVLDWLDDDINTRFPGGAEDGEYLSLTPPYRAANRAMADPTELRLVAGVTPEIYAKLAPYVTALPRPTAINLNTAPAEVLTVLANGVTVADAQQLVAAREKTPFDKASDALGHAVLAGKGPNATGLGVKSDYFLAHATVNIGRITVDYYSVLERGAQGSEVLIRGRGAYGT